MGAGRKTQTFIVTDHSNTMPNFTMARNLNKSDLGGVIFGCKNNTMQECFTRELFGLPQPHFSYVKNITPGLPLFLFNYSDKTLHGVFEAVTTGQLRIESRAWAGNEAGFTQFPAQVKIRTRTECQPLTEEQFGPIIEANYYEEKHFHFELDRVQTQKLISLFLSFKATSTVKDAEKKKTQPKTSASSFVPNEGKRGNGFHAPASAPAPAPAPAPAAPVMKANPVDDEGDSSLYVQSSDLARHLVGSLLEDVEEVEHEGFGHAYSRPTPWVSLFKKPTPSDAQNKIDQVPVTINRAGSYRSDIGCDKKMISSQASLGVSDKNWGQSSPEQNRGNTNYFTQCEENAIPELNPFYEVDVDRSSRDSNKECYIVENAATEANVKVATDQIGTNKNHSETVMEIGFDIYSVMTKLLGEVNELRLSHQNQEKKIHTLEHDMVKSKLEIQLMKDKCVALEGLPTLKCINLKQEGSESNHDNHRKLKGSIVVVGGHDGFSWLPATDRYNPSLDLIEPCCPMRIALPYSSATMLNGKVYVLGGSLGGLNNVWHDAVEQYDPLNDKWTTCRELSIKRGSLAAVSFNDKIYAIGGRNGVGCFSDVEMYVLDIGLWMRAQCMQQQRFSHGAAEINGAIYVVGGFDGIQYLSSVERFDPRERSWTMLESMPTSRCSHSMVVFNDKLFAMGGYDGKRVVSTVEVFDPRKGSWMVGDNFKTGRADSSAVVIGDAIYALGGGEDKCLVEMVECYKEGSGWEATNLKGIGKRWCFSAFAL